MNSIRIVWLSSVFCTTFALASCGDDDGPSGTDAGTAAVDAGGTITDAGFDAGGASMPDAGPADDAGGGTDAGFDAGSSDAGVDAGGPEPCPTMGAMRTLTCGMCGMQAEACTGGFWTPASMCLGEGECAASAVDSMTNTSCGMFQRICSAMCVWGAWSRVSPDGECEMGTTRFAMTDCTFAPGRQQTCSATCAWVDSGDCTDECGDFARTTPETSVEICIPPGPFLMGNADPMSNPDQRPQRTVMMSAYYIDKYPVTNDRYRACVTAGVCELPATGPGLDSYMDPARGEYAVQGATNDFADFCMWDGGRRPLTEAQWEKAARGPAPRSNAYVYGDTWDCGTLAVSECVATWTDPEIPWPVTGLPGSRSYYGTHLQMGGLHELTSDFLYAYTSASLTDPANPTPIGGGARVWRGFRWWDVRPRALLTYRGTGLSSDRSAETIRCGRTPPAPP